MIFPTYVILTSLFESGKRPPGLRLRKLDQRGSSLALANDRKHLLVVTMRTAMVGRNGERGMSNDTTGIVSLLDVSTGKGQVSAEGYGGAAALSADGRLLATARGSDMHIGVRVRHRDSNPDPGALRLFETLTGREVLRFAGDPPTVLAFAPDGRHLLFGTRTGAVCLVETTPPGAGDNGKLDRKALDTFWTDLASDDAAVAFRAQVALSVAREAAPAFLAERLRPAPADDAVLKRLIADLDAERVCRAPCCFRRACPARRRDGAGVAASAEAGRFGTGETAAGGTARRAHHQGVPRAIAPVTRCPGAGEDRHARSEEDTRRPAAGSRTAQPVILGREKTWKTQMEVDIGHQVERIPAD